jgi:hypothetical protein
MIFYEHRNLPMKLKSLLFLIQVIALLASTNAISAQVIVRHFGATDPVLQGFPLAPPATTQNGPVLDDFGRDAWSISTTGGQPASYAYMLSPEEVNAATTNGWILFARMRSVTAGRNSLRFDTGTQSFRLGIELGPDGDITLWDVSIPIYTFEGAGNAYHEYSIVYDVLDQTAAVWIGGVGRVAELSVQSSPVQPLFLFGVQQNPGHSHWNEVTFTIVPEPTTVALLMGCGALAVVGAIRWRRRNARRNASD